jgi:hypothetical protein
MLLIPVGSSESFDNSGRSPRAWGQQAAQSFSERLGRAEFKRLAAQTLEVREIVVQAATTSPSTMKAEAAQAQAGCAAGQARADEGERAGSPTVAGLPDDDYAARFAKAKATTEDLFHRWVDIKDIMTVGVGGAIDNIGQGIAGQLVDGTYEWEQAWKAVLKEIIAVTVKMLVVQGITAAIAALTGGAGGPAAGAGSIAGAIDKILPSHHGGLTDWPRHHLGALKDDERPAVLQVGEFVMRRSAVESIGAPALWEMNRTGQLPASGDNYHINISVNATTGESDPRQLAEAIAEPLIAILQREKSRNREII